MSLPASDGSDPLLPDVTVVNAAAGVGEGSYENAAASLAPLRVQPRATTGGGADPSGVILAASDLDNAGVSTPRNVSLRSSTTPRHGDARSVAVFELAERAGSASSSPRAIHGDLSSSFFRQRSMMDAKKTANLDLESSVGLRPTVSMAKLESLAQTGALSPAAVLRTLLYILVWYTFSTFLTLYNKTLLGNKLGKFPAPMLMNTFHFGLQAVLSRIIVCVQSRGSENGITIPWREYFIRVVPTALGTAFDINLSNASLVFISVTFATMCKSASPIFLLLFAFAFRLESPSFKLLGIILIISIGILLTVAKETEFEFWGFLFVMLAAVMSGFRWCMTQILLQKDAYGLKDPVMLMSQVAPVMSVATLILSLIMDPWKDFSQNVYFDSPWHIARSCAAMLIGGSLAFFMVLTEYILVSATSAITVTIAGVVKEAVTIVVAVFYFHEKFTWLKGVGLFTIMLGVSLFNWYKYEKVKGHPNRDDESVELSSNGEAKYVILDDTELQDGE